MTYIFKSSANCFYKDIWPQSVSQLALDVNNKFIAYNVPGRGVNVSITLSFLSIISLMSFLIYYSTLFTSLIIPI